MNEKRTKNQNKNLLLTIEAIMNNLRPSERKVAKYVLQNYNKVKYQTVSELASNSDVSDASVMRFVKKLDFKGFQYFKLALASLNDYEEDIDESNRVEEIEEKDDIKIIMGKIKNNSLKSIKANSSLLDEKDLKKAVNYILEKEQIFLVGVGASGVLAQLLQYKLLRMGIKTNYIADSHLQSMYTSLNEKSDLVIGISQSGSTKDTVSAIKLAKDKGSTTICITAHLKSPIVEYSDVLLCTYSRKGPLGISPGWSSTSQLFVIETLAACIFAEIKKEAKEAHKITAEAVLKKLY
ncbi:MAG: MurR/RpiR family transcriptional regulator [Bacillota bacterium]